MSSRALLGRKRGEIIDTAFTTTWKTDNLFSGSSANNQIKLPLEGGGAVYNFIVDWGDGSTNTITSATQAETLHTYASIGVYTLKITGVFPKFYINNGAEKLKLIGIDSWGDVEFSSVQTLAYYGAINVASLPEPSASINSMVGGFNTFRAMSLSSLPADMTLPLLENATQMFFGNKLASLPADMTLPSLTGGSATFYNNKLIDLPTGMTLSSLGNGANMFFGNTINTTRYSQLLIDLENLNPNNSMSFHGGLSKYNSTGQTARNILTTSPRLWTITDGGLVT